MDKKCIRFCAYLSPCSLQEVSLPDDGAAWICGGGGGSGSAISLVWELRAGFSYRIEIGKGGTGGLPGKRGAKGSSSRFLEQAPGESWKLIAEAGGGYGGGKLHQELLFSPGGRGGVAMSNATSACVLTGMDGQSSRSELQIADLPTLSWYDPDHPTTFQRLSTSSRRPCTGKYFSPNLPEFDCSHQPDFFLACDNRSRCVGTVHSVPNLNLYAANVLEESFQLHLVSGAPAGGTPPLGSGFVKRGAGRGGTGHCAVTQPEFVDMRQRDRYGRFVDHNWWYSYNPEAGQGSPGTGGLASIRACGRRFGLEAAESDQIISD